MKKYTINYWFSMHEERITGTIVLKAKTMEQAQNLVTMTILKGFNPKITSTVEQVI